jgi:hypothetical protein
MQSNKLFFALMSPCIIWGWRPWRWHKPRAMPQIMSNRWDRWFKICSLLPSGKVPFQGYKINDIQCVTIGKSLIPTFNIFLKSCSRGKYFFSLDGYSSIKSLNKWKNVPWNKMYKLHMRYQQNYIMQSYHLNFLDVW